MTDGPGTLYPQRMVVIMFIGMDVAPDIVRRNAHTVGLVTVFITSKWSNHGGQRHVFR
jgi:hypothetical protein